MKKKVKKENINKNNAYNTKIEISRMLIDKNNKVKNQRIQIKKQI